ncbi:hypothetical protein Leryth_005268, partial [Lithospermum erythrorhizon]
VQSYDVSIALEFNVKSRGMAGKVVDKEQMPFDFEFVESDSDQLTAVPASQEKNFDYQNGPWIDPKKVNLRHRIGVGLFGDLWLATHHYTTKGLRNTNSGIDGFAFRGIACSPIVTLNILLETMKTDQAIVRGRGHPSAPQALGSLTMAPEQWQLRVSPSLSRLEFMRLADVDW